MSGGCKVGGGDVEKFLDRAPDGDVGGASAVRAQAVPRAVFGVVPAPIGGGRQPEDLTEARRRCMAHLPVVLSP